MTEPAPKDYVKVTHLGPTEDERPMTREELNALLSQVARRFGKRVLAQRFRTQEDDSDRMSMVRALNAILVTLSASMTQSELAALERRLDRLEGKSENTHRMVLINVNHEEEVKEVKQLE